MTRLNLLLLGVLMAGSIYLVRVTYEARRLFGELDRAQAEARQLETEFGRLQAERQAQATPLRVEKTARDKLQMRGATPAIAFYVPNPAERLQAGDQRRPPSQNDQPSGKTSVAQAGAEPGGRADSLASAGHALQATAAGATR